MNVQTERGIDIFCLPDNARCKLYNENPLEMGRCPCMKFDDFGDVCIPDLCEEYEEL